MKYVVVVTRVFGILTGFVLWGSAITIINMRYGHLQIGWYCLGAAFLYTFLESIWLVNKCICCELEGVFSYIWRALNWIDNWRKTIIYFGLAIPCYMEGIGVIWSFLSAIILSVCALLYFAKTFSDFKMPSFGARKNETDSLTRNEKKKSKKRKSKERDTP